mmetsp:Transcript_42049/g.104662  ORF Transcript_42049/g.104662 Transcript_42049/m.104662 type:complete len:217 (-) Transcript_42049:824-1474(-)
MPYWKPAGGWRWSGATVRIPPRSRDVAPPDEAERDCREEHENEGRSEDDGSDGDAHAGEAEGIPLYRDLLDEGVSVLLGEHQLAHLPRGAAQPPRDPRVDGELREEHADALQPHPHEAQRVEIEEVAAARVLYSPRGVCAREEREEQRHQGAADGPQQLHVLHRPERGVELLAHGAAHLPVLLEAAERLLRDEQRRVRARGGLDRAAVRLGGEGWR